MMPSPQYQPMPPSRHGDARADGAALTATAMATTATAAASAGPAITTMARRTKSSQELLLLQPAKSCLRTLATTTSNRPVVGKSRSSCCLADYEYEYEYNDARLLLPSHQPPVPPRPPKGNTAQLPLPSPRRNVSFHQVEIAEFAYELGDNPSVGGNGCPIQLGWDAQWTTKVEIDDYENGWIDDVRDATLLTSSSSSTAQHYPRNRRRTRQELRMPKEYRKSMAILGGSTPKEVEQATILAKEEALQRRRSIRQHLEGWDGWHYRLERAGRRLRKVASMDGLLLGRTGRDAGGVCGTAAASVARQERAPLPLVPPRQGRNRRRQAEAQQQQQQQQKTGGPTHINDDDVDYRQVAMTTNGGSGSGSGSASHADRNSGKDDGDVFNLLACQSDNGNSRRRRSRHGDDEVGTASEEEQGAADEILLSPTKDYGVVPSLSAPTFGEEQRDQQQQQQSPGSKGGHQNQYDSSSGGGGEKGHLGGDATDDDDDDDDEALCF